jgi:hypothetical protein
MFKFSDILGTLMQSGMSGSTTSRMQQYNRKKHKGEKNGTFRFCTRHRQQAFWQ